MRHSVHDQLGPGWSLPARPTGPRRPGHLLALSIGTVVLALLLMLVVMAEQAQALWWV